MYETLDTESKIFQWLSGSTCPNGSTRFSLASPEVPAGATITVYDKADSQTPIATLNTAVVEEIWHSESIDTNVQTFFTIVTQLNNKVKKSVIPLL